MSDALIEILKRGGCYWRRPPGPGRSLAIPNGTRFRIALNESASPPFSGGICRDGAFRVDDGPCAGRTFDSAAGAVAAVRDSPGDPFLCVAFLAGGKWLSADEIRRSGALPWDEADELALDIAIDAVRDKLRQNGEPLIEPALTRKAAEVMAVSPHFLDEAKQRLEWMKK